MSPVSSVQGMPIAPTGRPRTTYVTSMVTELSISHPAALLESQGQLLVNTVKAAVGKNRHHIPRLQPRRKPLHDGVRRGIEGGLVAGAGQRGDPLLRMHSLRLGNALLLEYSSHHNAIGQRQRLHQLALKNI